ncbi:hypothetical protein EHS13_32785 [Paenibacillus psychroresistens]|uniref:ABC transporter substrate-binding protein n=1 Tax=Paenibacillus psychroresistens TaxID=1778678 RepID=A0A6B8RS94_9BACL|nr:hypothetical protein [Paenibacillus psychroresistens]QGQ99301.1 hypothetical protein EHS13_32785 [Paenibacillus psychroresistens]
MLTLQYFTLTTNENTAELADHYLMTSQSMSEATHQNSDPIKSVFMNELKYAVKPSIYLNPKFNQIWDKQSPNIYTQFLNLASAEDNEVAIKLHELAQKVDQELNLLEEKK